MRRLRQITKANTGHGYTATSYILKDGQLKEVGSKTIKINETSIRLRDERSKWEEYVSGCGWFVCEAPAA